MKFMNCEKHSGKQKTYCIDGCYRYVGFFGHPSCMLSHSLTRTQIANDVTVPGHCIKECEKAGMDWHGSEAFRNGEL